MDVWLFLGEAPGEEEVWVCAAEAVARAKAHAWAAARWTRVGLEGTPPAVLDEALRLLARHHQLGRVERHAVVADA